MCMLRLMFMLMLIRNCSCKNVCVDFRDKLEFISILRARGFVCVSAFALRVSVCGVK